MLALLLSLAAVPATAPVALRPPVTISLSDDGRYYPGDGVHVKVRANRDGHLLVLQADPTGRVRVLFPLDPGDDDRVDGGRTYELRGRGDREAFVADEEGGSGTIFAAVGDRPVNAGEFAVNDHWDYRRLRLPDDADAESALRDLADQLLGRNYDFDARAYVVYEGGYAGRGTVVVGSASCWSCGYGWAGGWAWGWDPWWGWGPAWGYGWAGWSPWFGYAWDPWYGYGWRPWGVSAWGLSPWWGGWGWYRAPYRDWRSTPGYVGRQGRPFPGRTWGGAPHGQLAGVPDRSTFRAWNGQRAPRNGAPALEGRRSWSEPAYRGRTGAAPSFRSVPRAERSWGGSGRSVGPNRSWSPPSRGFGGSRAPSFGGGRAPSFGGSRGWGGGGRSFGGGHSFGGGGGRRR